MGFFKKLKGLFKSKEIKKKKVSKPKKKKLKKNPIRVTPVLNEESNNLSINRKNRRRLLLNEIK